MKRNHTHWHMRGGSHHNSPFFGIFLLIAGAIIILNGFFGYDIPVMRTIIALLLIYLGISTITGAWFYRSWSYRSYKTFKDNATDAYYIRKDQAHIRVTNDKFHGLQPKLWFETRAGQATIDLTPLDVEQLSTRTTPAEIYSQTRAGRTVFILPASLPVEIHTATSWGDTRLPDGNHNEYGTAVYESHPGKKPLIVIYSEVRMGNVDFVMA